MSFKHLKYLEDFIINLQSNKLNEEVVLDLFKEIKDNLNLSLVTLAVNLG